MSDDHIYAVYLHPQAIEALGTPIKPYITQGPAGPHIVCADVDTGGAFCELTLQGKNQSGKTVELELMIPSGMISLIISIHNDDEGFGFA